MPQQRGIAIVTGAATGIGRAVSLALLEDGWTVVLTGRRREALEEVAEGRPRADRTLVVPADVTRSAIGCPALRQDEGAVRPARPPVQQCRDRRAPVDPVEDLTFEQWRRVVDINLTGAFLCTQAAFRLMKDQDPRGGRIINNGSISAHAPRPNSAPYTATKHADHRADQIDLARRPEVRHRLRADRHRQRRDAEMAAQMSKGVLQAERRAWPSSRLWTWRMWRARSSTWRACRWTRTSSP